MSARGSPGLHDQLPAGVARAILEGEALRVHAVRVSLVRDDEAAGFAIDTLRAEGRPAEWEQTTQEICRIARDEMGKLSPTSVSALAVAAQMMPEDETPIIEINTWLSMQDNGGSWWEVDGAVSLVAAPLRDVRDAAERMKKRALEVVCQL